MKLLVPLVFLTALIPQQVSQHSLTTDEGLVLPLRYYAPIAAGAPLIILVHDWGGSMERWSGIAERLQGLGFGVVAFNLRGHGGSTTAYYYLSDEQIARMQEDVALAIRFARERGGEIIHILGAGLGANLALAVAAEDGGVSRIVAVSPGIDYRGVTPDKSLEDLPPERMLLVASLEDVYSVYSIRELVNPLPVKPETRMLNNAGHGVWILRRQEGIVDSIAAWLSGPY